MTDRLASATRGARSRRVRERRSQPVAIQLMLTSSVDVLLPTLNDTVEPGGIVTVCVRSVQAVWCPMPLAHVRALSALLTSSVTLLRTVGFNAVEILERSPARLEHDRALVNLGAGLRVRGQPEHAREQLTQALQIAHRLHALALAELARTELIASGARPRRQALSGPDALTPAELRTARMAAEGPDESRDRAIAVRPDQDRRGAAFPGLLQTLDPQPPRPCHRAHARGGRDGKAKR